VACKQPRSPAGIESAAPPGHHAIPAGDTMPSRAESEYRYEKLTWPEINDAVELGKVCIVPCGAVEQHGPLSGNPILFGQNRLSRAVVSPAWVR
jgi:hypothetical protein